jgi:imidazolonepropionase-like amidohydrolase
MPRKARGLLEKQAISFQKALDAGVKIALGTDLGSFGCGENAVELAYMVDAGMTPMEALVAGTRMGAECIGLGDRTGTLEPGKLADLLIVDGDPLADVELLQDPTRLRVIMKDGEIIKNTLDQGMED